MRVPLSVLILSQSVAISEASSNRSDHRVATLNPNLDIVRRFRPVLSSACRLFLVSLYSLKRSRS
jgi:hypothetical protein